MTEQDPSSSSDLRPEIAELIDEACDDFEEAWQGGKLPTIEEYLGRVDDEHREILLAELLPIEIRYRRRNSESPSLAEYVDRFPDQMLMARDVFQQLDKTQSNDPTQVCPSRSRSIDGTLATTTCYSQFAFHAEGGLGEVLRATDEQLGREVALKRIHPEHLPSQEMLAKFRIEAEVTSRLNHPGVVPVYGMGEESDGSPFYTMRFIEGDTLRNAIERFHGRDWKSHRDSTWRMELHKLLGHLIAACDTVAYAHNRGVLHRDIKPENIMLGKYGETLIVDWGLAEFIQRDETARRSGERTIFVDQPDQDTDSSSHGAGTVGYVSPEQLPEGEHPVGRGCDIYSLGATLYRILTGRSLFRGDIRDPHLRERICNGDFSLPREVNKACPAVLEAICLKAVAAHPDQRYATASDLAEDLRRWMADEPLIDGVYQEPLFEKLARCARRHKAWTVAALATALVILVSAVATTFALREEAETERRLRAEADAAAETADKARNDNLCSAASFAAERFGYEIDQRWRVLEAIAADPELHRLVKAAQGKEKKSAEWNELQVWLGEETSPESISVSASSWFITDDNGVQMARNPFSDTIGKSFRRRSYFHGGGRDYEEDDPAVLDLKPVSTPCLSAVYQSKTTFAYKVAFSVPIRARKAKGDQEILGVLGMSIEFGKFVRYDCLPEGAALILADLRPDWLTSPKEADSGLILDHPGFRENRITAPKNLSRLSDSYVADFNQLRKTQLMARLLEKESNRQSREMLAELKMDFCDPAAHETADRCIAAVAPVYASGRKGEHEDVGWVVIIEDCTPRTSSLIDSAGLPSTR